MAEGWKDKVLCRYFMNGACRLGSQCSYSHDSSIAKPSMICKFYLRGTCAYGRKCRYDHIRPSNTRNDHTRVSNVDRSNGIGRGGGLYSSSNAGSSRHPQGSSSSSDMRLSAQRSPSPGRESRRPHHYSASHSSSYHRPVPFRARREDETELHLTVLKKQSHSADSGLGEDKDDWVNAPEFIPEPYRNSDRKSYASATGCSGAEGGQTTAVGDPSVLCPYALVGECRYGETCAFLHGEICDFCGRPAIIPGDKEQRKKHEQECIEQHQEDMEHSFRVATSQDKSCGVCMEVIVDKVDPKERRFGILPNCNHCFCLNCIRKWRAAKQFENNIVRACPECRVTSDFVCPSRYWVDNKEEKDRLIGDYKTALSKKECKYFKRGDGECPFGNKCFYKHALPDGTTTDVGPPRRRRRRNADGDVELMDEILLNEFIEARDAAFDLQLYLMELMDSDSDDSDSQSTLEDYLDDVTLWSTYRDRLSNRDPISSVTHFLDADDLGFGREPPCASM